VKARWHGEQQQGHQSRHGRTKRYGKESQNSRKCSGLRRARVNGAASIANATVNSTCPDPAMEIEALKFADPRQQFGVTR